MGIAGLIMKAMGFAAKVAEAHLASRARQGGQTYFETDIIFPEKAINIGLSLAAKGNPSIENPSVEIHDKYFELAYTYRTRLGERLFCRVPLHIAALAVNNNESYAEVHRAGKISVASESVWKLFLLKGYQAYFNSRYGERNLLGAVSKGVEHVDYRPSFWLCGREVHESALCVNLDKVLREHRVASLLYQAGVMNIAGISGLREEEGQLVVTLTIGKHD
jgi:hypothetical protein